MEAKLIQIQSRIERELLEDILPFWEKNLTDTEYGGFYSYATNALEIDKQAEKGCILNSRILWTYSAAYRIFGKESFRKTAEHAFRFLKDAFWDQDHQGLYLMVDYQGKPVNRRKQIYNIAFGIYGLSEFFNATGNTESLSLAFVLYELIEKHSYDHQYGGYVDALSEKWELVEDMRLSAKDMNAVKTMNTHLHMMEAYTNFYKVTKNKTVKEKLIGLIDVIQDKVFHAQTGHFQLFFNRSWESISEIVSFGHDIEGSWLLCEAAELIGEPGVIKKAQEIALKMVETVLKEGYDEVFGGIYNEASGSRIIDFSKDWWPQAEAVVGFLNAYCLTGEERYLDAVKKTWEFIDKYIVDHQYGEWFRSVNRIGKPNMSLPKVESWKCPYHNGRCCFEFLHRVTDIYT